MRPGGRTPEELETLFEDACLVGDGAGLAGLFEEGAVLAVLGTPREARGAGAIEREAGRLVAAELVYVAGPSRVVQARDTGLVLGAHAVNVVRRDGAGVWRYAISLLTDTHQSPEEP